MEIFKILNFWLHLMSGMIWVGGILFFSLTLLPTVRMNLPREVSGPFLRDLYIRFLKVSAAFVVILLISGGINVHFSKQLGPFSDQYLWALNIKIVLFIILITTFFLNFKNIPEIRKSDGLTRIPFQNTTLVVGTLIILMAAFLKHSP